MTSEALNMPQGNFSDLTVNFSPERKAKIAHKTQQLKSEMALNELREAFSLTQDQLASKLNVKQPAISRLEQRSDMYISHLREVIEAMGGTLDIIATFDDRQVQITNFHFSQPDSPMNNTKRD